MHCFVTYIFLVIPLILNVADPCAEGPCENGGTCAASDAGSYTCTCADGYTGDTCSQGQLVTLTSAHCGSEIVVHDKGCHLGLFCQVIIQVDLDK